MAASTATDRDWVAAIARVLRGQQPLRMVFQPIVELVTGTIVGYEALSRFSGSPDAPPDVWFAQADRLGLGALLEARAIRQALAARDELPRNCFLAINVSPHLLGDPEIWTALNEPVRLDGVVVEFTEHRSVVSLDELRERADLLRSRGAVVALDDAGSGYSGLQQIVALRPQLVKLDRSMVADVDRDPAKLGLAELLGDFAGRIDAWLLAEGVERREELAVFIELGVPLAQGWVFGRPGAGFGSIDPQVGAYVRELNADRGPVQTVLGLVDASPWSHDLLAPTVDELARDDDVRVVVDGDHRPTHVVLRDPRSGEFRTELVGLTTLDRASTAQTLQAALSRDAAHRFDPVVCTDDNGCYVGVLRVERLASATCSDLPPTSTAVIPPTVLLQAVPVSERHPPHPERITT